MEEQAKQLGTDGTFVIDNYLGQKKRPPSGWDVVYYEQRTDKSILFSTPPVPENWHYYRVFNRFDLPLPNPPAAHEAGYELHFDSAAGPDPYALMNLREIPPAEMNEYMADAELCGGSFTDRATLMQTEDFRLQRYRDRCTSDQDPKVYYDRAIYYVEVDGSAFFIPVVLRKTNPGVRRDPGPVFARLLQTALRNIRLDASSSTVPNQGAAWTPRKVLPGLLLPLPATTKSPCRIQLQGIEER